MSFLQGLVGKHGIYRRRFKRQEPLCTAFEAIDSRQRTAQRWNDMSSKACYNLGYSQASHVIPAGARAEEWNLWEAVKEAKP